MPQGKEQTMIYKTLPRKIKFEQRMFEKPHLHIWLLSGQSFNQKGFSEEEKTNKQTHLIHGQLDRQSIGAVYTYNSM
jgi:hypothetical protein